MSGDASDSSDDSEGKTNEKPCTVKHQITNGKSLTVPAVVNCRSHVDNRGFSNVFLFCNVFHILMFLPNTVQRKNVQLNQTADWFVSILKNWIEL